MTDYTGTTGNDSLIGGTGADLFAGDAGNDTLSGLAGNDVIYGDAGRDSLLGGADHDSLFGGTEADTLDGGAGNDTLDGGGDNDMLVGGTENDVLYGAAGNDTLDGGTFNDVLDGGLGIDSMLGGLGDDSYYFDDIGDLTIEAAASGTDLVIASISHTLAANIENLRLVTDLDSTNIDGTGNALNNLIQGNETTANWGGENRLYGLDGVDTLYGYNGLDTLDGGTGADVMYGGKHSDIYIVDNIGDQVMEYTGEGDEDTVVSSINYTLYTPVTSNFIENIELSGTANLTATGNGLDNTLTGNRGNNSLSGGGGNDLLRGQALGDTLAGGDDTLDGGVGDDTMYGALGNDLYYVDSADDEVIEQFEQGIDTVFSSLTAYTLEQYVENLVLSGAALNGTGNGENNRIEGNSGNNLLSGGANQDTLLGGLGNDTLDGGLGDDLMQGGAGNDVYRVNTINDVSDESTLGATGVDLVEATASHTLGTGVENLTITSSAAVNGTGNALDNVLTGGTGKNLLDGGLGDDSLYGGGGDDTLIGGSGTDSLAGGAGNDTYVLDVITESVVEAAAAGNDTVQIAQSYTLAENFEHLTLLGTGAFTATGNAAANILTGNTGDNGLYGGALNDKLYGGLGNDVLDGGSGNDTLDGGAGDDIYYIDSASDSIVEVATGGTDRVYALVSHTLGTNVENVDLIGSAHINATGNAKNNLMAGNTGNNLLSGGSGADVLTGNDGDDTLDGGLGNDTLIGGAGNDTFVIDVATDVIVESAAGGSDTVMTALSHVLADNFENLTLTGTTSVAGTGNAVDNVLTGNTGANALYGLAGNDTLTGGAGHDMLDGGTGNDLMIGGIGNDTFVIDALGDTAVEDAAAGVDTLRTIFTTTLGANFENLVLLGAENLDGTGTGAANRLTGNGGANQLFGLEGNDTIGGGAGDDWLDGGAGVDSLVGGLGDDTYIVDGTTDKIVEAAASGTDTVYASASYVLSDYLERLTLTGTAALNATGNAEANLLTGNSGSNSLSGGLGNDTLTAGWGSDVLNGGAGADSMVGGMGNDAYYVDNALDIVVEAADAGTDTLRVTTHATLGANVENMVMLSTGAYRGTGNGLDNVMTGNAGKNTLSGMAGDDTLNGGAGVDVLTGGAGADHFVFSSITAGNDTITDFNAVNGGAAEGDVLQFTGLLVGSFAYRGAAAFTAGLNNSEARFDTTTKKLLIDVDGNGVAEFALTLTGMDAASEVTAADFLWS